MLFEQLFDQQWFGPRQHQLVEVGLKSQAMQHPLGPCFCNSVLIFFAVQAMVVLRRLAGQIVEFWKGVQDRLEVQLAGLGFHARPNHLQLRG